MRSVLLATTLGLVCLFAGCGDDAGGSSGTDGTSSGSGSTTADTGSTTAAQTNGTGAPTSTTEAASGSTSSSGVADTGSDSTTSDTDLLTCPDVGDPCTICESTECPDDYCGCFNNGSCVLLAQCTAACAVGDADCNQACWRQYPEGISDGALLTHCAATTCTAQCGPFVPLTECQLCLYGECPGEMNTCVSNPECTALLACLDLCEDPGCENTCYAVYPDGLADSGPVGECAQDACLQECA